MISNYPLYSFVRPSILTYTLTSEMVYYLIHYALIDGSMLIDQWIGSRNERAEYIEMMSQAPEGF